MRRTFTIASAWLAGTLVAVTVAAAAVGSVRSEVTDAPMALGSQSIVANASPSAAGDTSGSPSTTTPIMNPEDADQAPTTTTQADDPDDEPTTSTTEPVTTTTVAQVTTTTQPPQTTTTLDGYTKTYDTAGGSVRINVSGDSVTFAGATPLPGWTVELENSGPEEVKVHFERNDDEADEIDFKAKIEDGELEVSISESDDD